MNMITFQSCISAIFIECSPNNITKKPHETAAVWNQFKARPQSKELSISLTVDQNSVKGTKETDVTMSKAIHLTRY